MSRSIVRTALRMMSSFMAVSVVTAQCLPVRAELPVNLDLNSTNASATAPTMSSPVTIMTGGQAQHVNSGAALTPAQAVAVSQILATGTQSIILGALGNATGGSLTLNAQQMAGLNVPNNVSTIANFTNGAPLAFAGNLANSGTLYAVSTSTSVTHALISALNIHNTVSGTITSVLPAGGLPGFGSAISNLGLSLNATNNLINSGTISSAADLNLAAGNQIVNTTSSSVMSALGSINMATAALDNHGLIAAANNINLVGSASNLLVNNLAGTLNAANGSILFDLSNGVSGDLLSVIGGNLLSQQVNVNAGCAHLHLTVDQLAGQLNVTAGSANAGSFGGLNLGAVNITGDPTFFSNLGIAVTGPLFVNERLTLIAANDIDLGNASIAANNAATGQGFDITIIAGANFTTGSLNSTPNVGPIFGPPFGGLSPGQTVKVSGNGSINGGSILCTNCGINTTSVDIGQGAFNGGNIFLAAYKGISGGNIELSGASVFANSALGNGGNVTIIAPGIITISNVEFSHIGSDVSKNGGKFTVTTAQPTGSITADSTGKVTGTLTPSSILSPTGEIRVESSSIIAGR